MMRKPAAYFVLTAFVIVFACGSGAVASGSSQYGAKDSKMTTVETSTGRRLVITTDATGTIITEERGGREVSRYSSDRHEAKLKEYIRSGAKVVTPRK